MTTLDDVQPEQLQELLELQDLDASIRRLEHQLEHLPEQQELDGVAGRDRELSDAHAEHRVELDRLEAQQRQLEGEIDLLRQRKEAEQTRMYGGEISNPRELQSLRAEIESTDRRIGDHEDRLLGLMEAIDSIQGEVATLEGERGSLAEDLERLTAARDEAAQGLIARLAELKVSRDAKRETLPGSLVALYDDAAERHSGAAVGALEQGMCTACRIELPVAEVNELLDGPPLGRCPNCRRPLVVSAA